AQLVRVVLGDPCRRRRIGEERETARSARDSQEPVSGDVVGELSDGLAARFAADRTIPLFPPHRGVLRTNRGHFPAPRTSWSRRSDECRGALAGHGSRPILENQLFRSAGEWSILD